MAQYRFPSPRKFFISAQLVWTLLSNRGKNSLSSILGVVRCSSIDRMTGSSRQLLWMLRENRASFCISSQQVTLVKYSMQKRFCNGNFHSRLSKPETCVDLFQSIENLSILLEGFSQLTSQDGPCLVTQIVYNCCENIPKYSIISSSLSYTWIGLIFKIGLLGLNSIELTKT